MKKTALVVVLALALTFAFVASASATTGKFYAGGVDYYRWSRTTTATWEAINGPVPAGVTAFINDGVSTIASNTVLPGVHGNYLANTAKCGICHSVHRAAGTGSKLLPIRDASCAGCHTGTTAISAKIITWTPASTTWVPEVALTSPLYPVGGTAWMAATDAARLAAITNGPAAGGAAARDHFGTGSANSAGGPHNDSLVDMVGDGFWDGTGTPPLPDYEGYRYGCFTRRCHATNPHGADSSAYPIFAAKLLFNTWDGSGTYGGLDAAYDGLGGTDAAVARFVAQNSGIITTDAGGNFYINGVAPDADETHALVAGLTCGRPSNPHGGEDECHAEASYAIVDKGITEMRNKGTGLSGTAYRTDNTQAEELGYGGNDSRTLKTGHVAGTFAAVPEEGSYAPIAGCTSCHDQTDSANTVAGNFTFPHGQTPVGTTNAMMLDGHDGSGHRSRIWSGWSGGVGQYKFITSTAPAGQKAFDGQCLKCHRSGTEGIGLTK